MDHSRHGRRGVAPVAILLVWGLLAAGCGYTPRLDPEFLGANVEEKVSMRVGVFFAPGLKERKSVEIHPGDQDRVRNVGRSIAADSLEAAAILFYDAVELDSLDEALARGKKCKAVLIVDGSVRHEGPPGYRGTHRATVHWKLLSLSDEVLFEAKEEAVVPVTQLDTVYGWGEKTHEPPIRFALSKATRKLYEDEKVQRYAREKFGGKTAQRFLPKKDK